MAHHDYCSVEITDGRLEHVLGAHIQMIGGLIKNQTVDRLKQELDHGQSGTFSTAQELDLLVTGLAPEHEGTQDISDLRTYVALGHTVDGIKDRQFPIEQLGLVLCEVSYLHIMPHPEATCIESAARPI